MIPFGGDSWTFSIGGDPDVNLCVWVLLRDGLQVPPLRKPVLYSLYERLLRSVSSRLRP
jgi:hypothetical protein